MKSAFVTAVVGLAALAGCEDGPQVFSAEPVRVFAMVQPTEHGGPAVSQQGRDVRLADLPRQIREYHQSNYVDDCRSMDGGRLTVRELGYVQSGDLNGDGRTDYVLRGTHLECSVGASYICGNGTCPFNVFVATNQGFRQGGVVGHEVELERVGDRDFLQVTTRDGNRSRWGWNGVEFSPMPAGGAEYPSGSASTGIGDEPIRLDVSFTPEAQMTLARRRERIIVNAYYAGESHPDYNGDTDEMGWLVLGEDLQMTTPAGGQVVLSSDRIDRDQAQHIVGNANVRITARGHMGTELSCAIDGPISDMAGRVSPMVCDLAR